MNWYLIWRLVHLAGVLVFVAGHGVSVAVTVRLPRERDRSRLEALLSLSRSSIPWSNAGLLVLLVGGIANWIRVDYAPQGWLWAASGILAVLAVVGVTVAAPHFRRIRSRLGAADGSLEEVLRSRLPWTIFWVETIGTAAIVWLMVYKPF
ncbi:MAG TPA: hypothetical protein VE669_05260 [Actinomycetota bacterium]|nr:hypothetical protein [Actinomycetota bacterium]